MLGRMQDWPLLMHKVIDFAAVQFPEQGVASRTVEGPMHYTNYREVRQRALKVAKRLERDGIELGDRANREVLNLYEAVFREHPDKKDLRWRIEHAQHLDPADIPRFGTLGVIAVIIKQEILLFFVGGIFVIEALSVILQVGSFKLRGKRIFRMAPIHHHFELLGWSESKVIVRFWIAALVFALFALTTLKLR